jgi:hypothetical protein
MVREPARIVPKTLCHSAGGAARHKTQRGKENVSCVLEQTRTAYSSAQCHSSEVDARLVFTNQKVRARRSS